MLLWSTLVFLLGSILLGFYLFDQLGRTHEHEAQAQLQKVLRVENRLNEAFEAHTLRVQEWKDVLLRAYDPLLLHKHKQAFDQNQLRVPRALEVLQLELSQAGMNPQPVADLIRHNLALSELYHKAYAELDAEQPLSYRRADQWVRGRDRELRAELVAMAGRVQAELKRQTQDGNLLGANLPLRDQFLLVAVIFPLLALALFLLMYRTLRHLAQGDARMRGIFASVGDAVVVSDAHGKIEWMNDVAAYLLDWPLDEAQGRPVHEVMTMYDARGEQRVECPIEEVLREGLRVPTGNGILLRNRGGREYAIEDSATPVRAANGRLKAVVMVLHDVSERYAMLKNLRRERALFQQTFDLASVGMAHLGLDGRWIRVNRELCDITGYDNSELLALSWQGITHPDDRADDGSAVTGLLRGEIKQFFAEKRYLRKDGAVAWVEVKSSPVWKEDGTLDFCISIIKDITAQKAANREIEQLAYHDQLTGLANRRLLHDRLAQAVSGALRREAMVGVLFLDLDNFKNVNDTLGHQYGDELLKVVAQRLKTCVRAEDTVARVGGDEFVVMLGDVAHSDDVAEIAQKIIETVKQVIPLNGNDTLTTTSVGISLCPQDAHNVDDLLTFADAALYQAKQQGRATYRFYTEALHRQAVQRMNMERHLRRAIARQEFELYYQPKLNLADGTLVGCEALIRWHQPALGMVPPDQFIPVAEQSSLINDIGAWVIHSACQQAASWQRQGTPLRVAFNVSARQFMRPQELLDTLRLALARSTVDAQWLEIEMTESLLLNAEDMGLVLQQIRAMGIRLTLDDFGTGYSSLSYLRRFPIDTLKIDRSFVSDADHDAADAEMVKTIIGMAHNLHMAVVAEGIETESQRNLLVNQGCEVGQGYLFSRPVPLVEFEQYMREPRRMGR